MLRLRTSPLWDDHTLSDVTIVLKSHDEPSSCSFCQHFSHALAEASDSTREPSSKKVCRPSCCARRLQLEVHDHGGHQSQPRARLPSCMSSFQLHAVVLSDASSYYKALFSSGFLGWCPDCKIATQILGSGDLEAAEKVLRFIYTDELPADGAMAQGAMILLSMIQVADRWDVPACIKACKLAICALNDAKFPIDTMFSLPATFLTNPAITELIAESEVRLLRIFGDAQAVLSDTVTLTSLTSLPHAAMLSLLISESLSTDSEATVLLLVARWYKDNCKTCSKSQLKALKKWVRYGRLDALYICNVLQQMPAFCPSLEQINELWTASATRNTQNEESIRSFEYECPENWFLPDRPGKVNCVKLHLKVPRAKLLSHVAAVAKMQAGGHPPEDIFSEKVYGLGYSWRLSLFSKNCTDALSLGYAVYPPDGVTDRVAVKILANLSGPEIVKTSQAHILVSGQRMMWVNVCENADVVLAGDGSIVPWLEKLVDNNLCFDMEIKVL